MGLSLEVFPSDPTATPERTILEQIDDKREQALAYETGYRAGWEEANATATALVQRGKTDLAQHMQQLSFTYHEAQAHVLAALRPLLLQVVGQILPHIARESLAPMVVETLIPLANCLGQAPLTLRVNPATQAAVQTLIEATTTLPLTVQADPTLGTGVAQLTLGSAETVVDLDQATTDIATAVRGFFALYGKETILG